MDGLVGPLHPRRRRRGHQRACPLPPGEGDAARRRERLARARVRVDRVPAAQPAAAGAVGDRSPAGRGVPEAALADR